MKNAITWTAIVSLHFILFVLSALHRLTQIQMIQIPLNMMQQSFLVHICLFWPRFYFCLFKPNENRRSIWEIITCPVPPEGRKASTQSNRIPCINSKYCCFSFYKVQGAYTHLNQKQKKDLDEKVAAETTLVFFDDPLHLAVPYVYFLEMLPEPPDGLLKSILSLTLMLIVYLYPVLRGLIRLWVRFLSAQASSKRNNGLFFNMDDVVENETRNNLPCI